MLFMVKGIFSSYYVQNVRQSYFHLTFSQSANNFVGNIDYG